MFIGDTDQVAEIFTGAELRVNSLMSAFFAADGVGAAWVIRPCFKAVVRAFAMRPTDRVNRREIEHIKAHIAYQRQAPMNILERTVAIGIIGFRAGNSSYQLAKRALSLSTSSG